MLVAFCIWELIGCGMIVFGVICRRLRRPVGFWANAPAPKVADVRGYNRAVGTLWVIFGVLFALLGAGFAGGEGSPWVLLTVLGSFFWMIALLLSYQLAIAPKYKA